MNPVAAAQAAAEAAGVTIDELDGIADLEAAAALFGAVWDTDTEEPVPAALLVAMAHAGAYVAGARSGRELVGAVAAFAGVRSSGPVLHSHIMGVAEVRRGGGVGFAMKLHQRAWCIERNIEAVEWTFDPLIAANAWFNIGRLASDAVEFRSAFYGVMHDGLNAGDETDRLVVSWRLRSDRVAAAAAGHPHAVSIDDAIAAGASVVLRIDEEGVPVSGSSAIDGTTPLLCAVPDDIVAVRRTSADLSRAWRLELRDVFQTALAAGYRVTGFDRSGWYILET